MQGDLSSAVTDAVRDYVRLRGLNNLCPDVKKWSPPPGPSAYLDAGLPKITGDASVPRGLLLASYPSGTPKNAYYRENGGRGGTCPSSAPSNNSYCCGIKGSGSGMDGSGASKNYPFGENGGGDGSGLYPSGASKVSPCWEDGRGGGGGGGMRKGVGVGVGHKRSNSIPPPTWETKGPEGFNSQVLSFDDDTVRMETGARTADGASMDGGLLGLGESISR